MLFDSYFLTQITQRASDPFGTCVTGVVESSTAFNKEKKNRNQTKFKENNPELLVLNSTKDHRTVLVRLVPVP